MKEAQLIASLSKGNKNVLKDIYLEYKEAFLLFAKRYTLSEDDLLDIYQDATIALFENAIDGKLNNIQCTIKTYLFSIGKNMIFQQLKHNNKSVLINTQIHASEEYDYPIDLDETSLSIHQQELQKAFKLLGEQCKKILTLFYYNGFTLDEITITLQYQKKDVVKSQKSRCLAQLKNLVKNHG